MADNLNINLNVNADNSIKSLKQMKEELKSLDAQIRAAGEAGDVALGQKLQTQYAELRNDIKDTSEAMKNMDTGDVLANWTSVLNGVLGGFSAVTGAMSLFGVENENLQNIEKKSMQLIQTMMGLEKIRAVLIDEGGKKQLKALIAATKAIFTKSAATATLTATETADAVASGADAVAKTGETIATKAATKAQWNLNAAMAANPIGALLTALVLLITAIVSAVSIYKKFKAAQEANTEAANAFVDTLDLGNEKLRDAESKTQSYGFELKTLYDIYKNTKAGTEENESALAQLAKTTGLTKGEIKDMGDGFEDYVTKAYKAAIATAKLGVVTQEYEDLLKTISKAKTWEAAYIAIVDNKNLNTKAQATAIKELAIRMGMEEEFAEEQRKLFLDNVDRFGKTYAVNVQRDNMLKKLGWRAGALAAKEKELLDIIKDNAKANGALNSSTEDNIKSNKEYDEYIKSLSDDIKRLSDDTAKLTTENDKLLQSEKGLNNVDIVYKTAFELKMQKLKQLTDEMSRNKTLKGIEKDRSNALIANYGEQLISAIIATEEATKAYNTYYDNIQTKSTETTEVIKSDNTEIIDAIISDMNDLTSNIPVGGTGFLKDLIYGDSDGDSFLINIDEAKERLQELYDGGLISAETYSSTLQSLTDAQTEYIIGSVQMGLEYAKEMMNEIGSLAQAEADLEISESERKRRAELDNENLTEQEKEEINKKYDERKKAIEREAAKKQKDIDIANVLISSAVGIMQGFAQAGPIGGAILALLTTAMAGIQIAAINKQFQAKINNLAAKGDFVTGASHQNGGVQYEVEGGEAILNKKAMSIPGFRALASAMNQSTGGVAFPLIGSSNQNNLISASIDTNVIEAIVTETVAKVTAIPVVVSEKDISKTIKKVNMIERTSRI